MKKLFFVGNLVLAGAMILASCDSTTSEKVEERADTIANKIDAAVDKVGDRLDSMDRNDAEDDADFVKEVAKANKMELRMLADAKTMGTDAELKSAAKKMEADHKKLATELKEYASKKNIVLDTAEADHNAHSGTKGADWDKKWANDMADEHEREIRKFEKEEKEVMDAELKTMISNTLPTLREHLEMSKKLQAKYNK